jgi:hypothetical protein
VAEEERERDTEIKNSPAALLDLNELRARLARAWRRLVGREETKDNQG